jgi:NitT/TauT family transport system ATP-binding protein
MGGGMRFLRAPAQARQHQMAAPPRAGADVQTWGPAPAAATAQREPHAAYLRVTHVTKRFGGPGSLGTEALANVSCEVQRGDFVSIVGPSGCGKSTLLQMMGGLMRPTSGEIWLDGAAVTAPRFEVIYLFQQYTKTLYPWLTVQGNVSFGMRFRGVPKDEIRARCERYLGLVGLKGVERLHPWQLSGGMQQRVAIARALACEPQVLLMDEPFSSVDALTRASLQDLVLRIWADLGLTIVFITHDTDEAVYLSRRVLVMSQAPGMFTYEVEVDLPYPRNQLTTRESEPYLRYRHEVLSRLVETMQSTTEPQISGAGPE